MSDNQPHRSSRQLDVAPDGKGLEEAVRRSLAGQAAGVRPSGADLAGVAVARVRRLRRRHTLLGLAVLVVATVVASGVLLDWSADRRDRYAPTTTELLLDAPTTAPARPHEPARLAADGELPAELSAELIGAGTGGAVLAGADGNVVGLGQIGQVVAAHRIGAGVAVVSDAGGVRRLWWVESEQGLRLVLTGLDAVVVEGARIAWRRGVLLATETLSADGALSGRVVTTAPAGGGLPVGFLGDAVLLAGEQGWDTWNPAGGAYQPTWSTRVARVYGAQPDGVPVGLVPDPSGGGGSCLARLVVEPELAPADSGCVATSLTPDRPAALSPDGRWLLAVGDGATVLVDLTAPAAGAERLVEEAPAPVATPVWLAADRVAFVAVGSTLVQLWPDGPRVELYPLAGDPPVLVQPG
jgi:hypothetical protein